MYPVLVLTSAVRLVTAPEWPAQTRWLTKFMQVIQEYMTGSPSSLQRRTSCSKDSRTRLKNVTLGRVGGFWFIPAQVMYHSALARQSQP